MTGISGSIDWNKERATSGRSISVDRGLHWQGDDIDCHLPGLGRISLTGLAGRDSIFATDSGHVALLGAHIDFEAERCGLLSSGFSSQLSAIRRMKSDFLYCSVDADRRVAVIAVDAFSSWPVYYTRSNGAFLFSTDLSAIARHPWTNRTINAQSIYDYLYYTIIPAPHTIYEEVSRVTAGHLLVVTSDGTEVQKWYEPESPSETGAQESQLYLQRALEGAVSDAAHRPRTASFLSGGLDSSTVCGFAARSNANAAFTIGFKDDDYDEIPYAKIVAEEFRLQHHVHYVEESEILEHLEKLVTAVGEPFSNASTITAYVCGKLAKDQGFDHMLAGDGGDELFAGNERYQKQLALRKFEFLPSFIRKALQALNHDGREVPTALLRKVASYVTQASLPEARRLQYYNFIEQSGVRNTFSPRFLEVVDPEAPIKLLQSNFDNAPFDDFLKKLLYVDWQITLADNDLRKVRQACNLAEIDVSFPMLDARVLEVSEKLSGSTLMPSGRLRGFYKDTFSSFLPEAIINKPKHGFGVPVGRWMRPGQGLDSLVSEKIAQFGSREILNRKFLAELKTAHETADAVHFGVILWNLLILELWLEANGADV